MNEFKAKNGLIVADGTITFKPLTTAGILFNSSTGLLGTSLLGNGLAFVTSTLSLATQMSITTDASGIKLSGDASTPGNSTYYGTNSSGIKGFYGIPNPVTLNGTGFVKASGTTISYDNTTYAALASPTFTGTPSLPTGSIGVTQTAGNSTTALATTAFVTTADNLKANIASQTFTGTPTLPTGTIGVTQTAGNSTTALATTAFVTTANNLKANLASPTFTGTVALPSITLGGTAITTTATQLNYINSLTSNAQTQINALAPLNSPTFTGTPTLPSGTIAANQPIYESSSTVANTAFVQTIFTGLGSTYVSLSGTQTISGQKTFSAATTYFSAVNATGVMGAGSSGYNYENLSFDINLGFGGLGSNLWANPATGNLEYINASIFGGLGVFLRFDPSAGMQFVKASNAANPAVTSSVFSVDMSGNVTANSFIGNGTSLTDVVHLSGNETVTGQKIFSATNTYFNTVNANPIMGVGSSGYNYMNISVDVNLGITGFGSNLWPNPSSSAYEFINTAAFGGSGAYLRFDPLAGLKFLIATNGANPAVVSQIFSVDVSGNVTANSFSNTVDLTSAQTISGNKYFTGTNSFVGVTNLQQNIIQTGSNTFFVPGSYYSSILYQNDGAVNSSVRLTTYQNQGYGYQNDYILDSTGVYFRANGPFDNTGTNPQSVLSSTSIFSVKTDYIQLTSTNITFTGLTIVSNLATGGTAPTTSGTTQMVICDANGLLSFAAIPGGGGGSGTVTSVSVVSANGFGGTVATSTTTPAITITTSITGILKGNGTSISAAVAGTDYLVSLPAATSSILGGVKVGTNMAIDGSNVLTAIPQVIISSTAPTSPATNQLWLDTSTASNITYAGNTFNGASELVQLDSSSDLYLPSNLNMNGTDPFILLSSITNPSPTPSSGILLLYSKSVSGRMMPKWKGPSGVDTMFQASYAVNNIVTWTNTSATAGLWYASIGAGAGTFAQLLPTTTNFYTNMKRGTYANVVTTLNQQVGQRQTDSMYFMGNASGQGGFFMVIQFGLDIWTTGARLFVGLSVATTAMVTVNPSTVNNSIGFCIDAGDTAITFLTKGTGTAVKTTISGQPTLANNQGYTAFIFCRPNDSTIYFRLDDINSDSTIIDSSVSTGLPAGTTMMGAKIVASNAALTPVNSVKIGLNKVYIETDK